MNKEVFGKFIADCRKEKGLTQQDLGKIIHISDKAISKWERGLSYPDIDIWEDLARALDITLVELLQSKRVSTKEQDIEQIVKDTVSISKESRLKEKKKWFRITTIILLIVVILIFFILYLLTPKYASDKAYSQEYIPNTGNIKGSVNKEYFEAISSDFAIGANKYGYAVFKNPDKAFKTLKKNYKEGISLIQKEYCKVPLSKRNFMCYKNMGWQVTKGSKMAREEARFVSMFLDIYESSFSSDTIYNYFYK